MSNFPEPNCTFWAELEDISCPCQGDGWANIDDEWVECPLHFQGQLHPESRELLLDDPIGLLESERNSILNWKITKGRKEVAELQAKTKAAQLALTLLELELLNRKPTIQIQAVSIPMNSYPTVQMQAVCPTVQMKAVRVNQLIKQST